MKENPPTLSYIPSGGTNVPDPVLLSRQIDGLREVLRRMKASAAATTLDPVISKKLEKLAKN